MPNAIDDLIPSATQIRKEAALKADPKDAECAVAIHDWYLTQARHAQDRLQKDEAAKLKKQGVEYLQQFAKSTTSPAVKGLVLVHDMEAAQLAAVAGKVKKAAADAVRAATVLFVPRLDDMKQAFDSPEALTLLLPAFQRFQQLEATIDPEAKLRRTSEVADALVAASIAKSEETYAALIGSGVAPECARFVLPLATKTTLYMTGSARSWIHYLGQRLSLHAQKEHRLVAEAIGSIFADQFPATWAAVNDITPEV